MLLKLPCKYKYICEDYAKNNGKISMTNYAEYSKTELQRIAETYDSIRTYTHAATLLTQQEDLVRLMLECVHLNFGQRHICFFEYKKQKDNLVCIGKRGFEHLEEMPVFETISQIILTEFDDTIVVRLCDNPKWKNIFDCLGLQDAVFCPIIGGGKYLRGFVVCGRVATDEPLLFPRYLDKVFEAMMAQAGLIGYNYRVNRQLKREVEQHLHTEEIFKEQAINLKRSNEDLEQFAYVISHDLKAPLRNITSFSQLLTRSLSDEKNKNVQEYLDFILKGVRQFNFLIDDLLLYSRSAQKQTEFELVDFNEVIETVKYNLNVLIKEKEAVVHCEFLPTINASFSQMTQVFQNLIVNGIKFRQKDVPPVIHISAVPLNDTCMRFAVSDNGIGIEPQYYERIFLLFQRLHHQSEYEGTGLGLSICRKIAERHRGKIWVESKGKNQGTTFYLQLPMRLKNEEKA